MTLPQAVLLGAVQGVTEFFPVSSSGHLVICQALFGLREPSLAFDIFLHAGTLVAVAVFFARDIARLFTTDRRTLLLLAVASVPACVVGLLFKDHIEALFASPRTVGFMLVATGVWLAAASAYGFFKTRKGRDGAPKELGVAPSLAVGLAQAVAVIPGISRSGATIATGILSGLGNERAFRFAFLLSLPAVGGACVLKARKIGAALAGPESAVFLAGGITAMLVGLASIGLLRRMVRENRLSIFGIYCIVVGGIVALTFK